MANTGLRGSFPLTVDEVDKQVQHVSPGAYMLGHTADGTFYVQYVGRSDDDLNARLNQHANDSKYDRFKFGYLENAQLAFEKECELYHQFGESTKLDNKIHPARPKGEDFECPHCAIFD